MALKSDHQKSKYDVKSTFEEHRNDQKLSLSTSLFVLHTLIHTLIHFMSHCLHDLFSSWPSLHFDDHISILCICIDINLSNNHLFRMKQHHFYSLYFIQKNRTHAYLQDTFYLIPAFRVCPWLFLYFLFSSGLFYSLLLLSGPSSSSTALFCLFSGEVRECGDRQLECEHVHKKKKWDSPFRPPSRPPCVAILRPKTPHLTPQDENSWSAAQIPKFQICPICRENNSA